MNRRDFLSATVVGAMSAGSAGAVANQATPTSNQKPAPLAPPPPGVDYFTQERLEKAIDTSASLDGIDFQAVCYVCNLWHPTPVLEKYHGKGFSEWEICRRAKALFEGHYQPKRPLWGYHKEAEVEWATREIDLAASSGIDVFMVDWYWHDGAMFMHEWLENAFLKSPSRSKMKFAVMWANHDWINMYLAPEEGQEAVLFPQNYSDADMDRAGAYLVEHYFTQPNYWKIDNKAVFATFLPNMLIQHFGAAKLHKIFDAWQSRAVKAGLGGIHFQSSNAFGGEVPLGEAGFSSTTDYHSFARVQPYGGRSPFASGAEEAIKRWKSISPVVKLPYFPNASVGWDSSPRYGKRTHVFTGRSADQYERLLVAAKHFVAATKVNPPLVYMGAWNEWTEDHFLLPDEVHGYSYLEAVRRQFA
jgi:hypothetical protein